MAGHWDYNEAEWVLTDFGWQRFIDDEPKHYYLGCFVIVAEDK